MSNETEQPELHPVQVPRVLWGQQAEISKNVTLAAYEVYSHVFAPQEALITGGCRGGFDIGELIAFLYARSFPKSEWKARSDEAFRTMKNMGGQYVRE